MGGEVKWLIVLIGVILVAIVFGGCYFFNIVSTLSSAMEMGSLEGGGFNDNPSSSSSSFSLLLLEQGANAGFMRFRITCDGSRALSVREVFEGLAEGEFSGVDASHMFDAASLESTFSSVTGVLMNALRNHVASALFFECRPITHDTLDEAFEFVLVDASDEFEGVKASDRQFKKYLAMEGEKADVVSFLNLGKDARLVVPKCAHGMSPSEYVHLKKFSDYAPIHQQVDFWSVVGASVMRTVSSLPKSTPVWVSTSGLGVFWLHMRLDSNPKYYTFKEYKTI
eukprot:m.24564 g.24564  ORF g.24564 m.24564 type:complete len:282 (-) comp5670_c0_seq1:902-1747(-)